MALSSSYDRQLRVLRINAVGSVSIDARIEFIARLLTDPALPDYCGVLIDVNRVTNGLTPDGGRVGGAVGRPGTGSFPRPGRDL